MYAENTQQHLTFLALLPWINRGNNKGSVSKISRQTPDLKKDMFELKLLAITNLVSFYLIRVD